MLGGRWKGGVRSVGESFPKEKLSDLLAGWELLELPFVFFEKLVLKRKMEWIFWWWYNLLLKKRGIEYHE